MKCELLSCVHNQNQALIKSGNNSKYVSILASVIDEEGNGNNRIEVTKDLLINLLRIY